ncbi:unnamed protein product [Cylicocyclus nassatus]|uniref:Uncharacterized protein n=1 Tax=Cylicocyclus nassatus TaxID=53992 RepID=A0AA36DJL2_CYLNA|nr:unnamed protein product [Cylicocyclus nassatus]
MPITCFLCGNKTEEKFTTRSSSNKTYNAILLAALNKYSSIISNEVECFAAMSTCRRYYCIRHCTNATQYILAEVIASGGRLSETLDHVSYINQSEISEHILASVNDAIKSFSNNITVTNYDLMRYLNGQLKKYYHEGRWEIPQLANLAEADYLQPITEAGTSGTQNFDFSMDYEMLQALSAKTQNLGSPIKTASSLLSTPCVKHTDSR